MSLVLPAPPAGVEWSATHLQVLDTQLSFEMFERLMRAAGGVGDTARWWLGDLLLFSEARYGERYAQALETARLSERQLNRYRYVCEKIARSRRRVNLPFSYHEEVAALEPATQDRLLERAESENWPREQLREAVRDARALNGPPARVPAARQEILDAPAVDTAGNLVAVRETLTKLDEALDSDEAREAIGLPRALRALDEASASVKRSAKDESDRPPLREASRKVRANATLSGGFYMVEALVFEEWAALDAADE